MASLLTYQPYLGGAARFAHSLTAYSVLPFMHVLSLSLKKIIKRVKECISSINKRETKNAIQRRVRVLFRQNCQPRRRD